jgi:hypothetical protein
VQIDSADRSWQIDASFPAEPPRKGHVAGRDEQIEQAETR